MRSQLRIQLWDEAVPLAEALNRLCSVGLQESVLQALSEQLIVEKSLRDYQLVQNAEPASLQPARLENLLTIHRQNLSEAQNQQLEAQLNASPIARQQFLHQLWLDDRLKALKLKVIPSTMVQEAFLNFKTQRESVIFQMLRTASKSLARELYFRLQHEGLDFAPLIQQYGEGPEAEQGGLLGPLPLGKIKPELRKTLQSLKNGEICAPFASEPGRWTILRLLRRDNLQLTPEVEAHLRDSMFANWLQNQVQSARSMPASLHQAVLSSASRTQKGLTE